MMAPRTPTALIILDGWGHRKEHDANAIAQAQTPFWDSLTSSCPGALIHTSGKAVGLPEGQMGNSEVGHMNLGAGRIVYQNFTRINKDIEDGAFATNPVICNAVDKASSNNGAVHIFGLLSPGGVHSHENQIFEACKIAADRGAKKVYLHAFLDGRDTPPQSAGHSLNKADKLFKELGCGRVASICGRYYAMDRDNRWDRVQLCYDAIAADKAQYTAETAMEALQAAYERNENDEFVKPTVLCKDGEPSAKVTSGDAIIFMNFRPDRSRELTRAFTAKDFTGFEKIAAPELADFVMLTEYAADIDASCAYPPEKLVNGLGEYMQTLKKSQLRIAETEKYAHVTFFFSGGQEAEYSGEKRILVPSPDVSTYDLKPEMSAPEVTDKLQEAIKSGEYDLIICNYANGDMVGHTGVFDAAIKAAECVDACLEKVTSALKEVGGQCLITADHGNAEQMVDENGHPHTQHTTGPVPLIYFGSGKLSLQNDGALCDIAPTLLDLMNIDQPEEMTGHSLINWL